MKSQKYILVALCISVIASTVCFSGCKTITTSSTANQNQGQLSIQVTLNTDGSFTYLGDIVERDDLPRILRRASGDYGRSITIKAADNVEKKSLIEARQFLVYKGFPNVTIVTQRIAVSYEEEIKTNNQ